MRVPSNFSGDIMIPLTGIFRKNYNTATGTFGESRVENVTVVSFVGAATVRVLM